DAPGNRPAVSSVGLSAAPDYLHRHHPLDDVLSVALEDHRIVGRTRDGARWSAALFLRPKATTTTTLCMKTQYPIRIVVKIFLLIVATTLGVFAQQNPEIAPRAIPVMPVAPAAAGPHDIARFLAGMPLPENSPLAPLTRDVAWQQHSAFFEKEFSKLNLRQLEKLHAWIATNLPEVAQPIPVAFYMFSGPDFLYIDQFFPNASVY